LIRRGDAVGGLDRDRYGATLYLIQEMGLKTLEKKCDGNCKDRMNLEKNFKRRIVQIKYQKRGEYSNKIEIQRTRGNVEGIRTTGIYHRQ